MKLAVCNPSGEVVAIKIMDKRQILKQDFTSQVRREIYIMRSLKHKHIVRMHEVLSSESKLYIVMDYIRGGELFHHLEKNGRVDESRARMYFQQLVDGVDFCHRSGVAHRDLKPENLLLDDNGDIQITDFGFSSMRGIDVNADLLHTQCGTPDYCAPEIIESSPKGYSGAKVDAWSCGIILYALLAGRLPFVEQDTEKLYDLILACNVKYPDWITPEARHLLEHLLVRNPAKRFGLQQVKSHPWFLVDYEGDDARLLKKRPFFNKNQKSLASVPTTPSVPEPSPLENIQPSGQAVEETSSLTAQPAPAPPVQNSAILSEPASQSATPPITDPSPASAPVSTTTPAAVSPVALTAAVNIASRGNANTNTAVLPFSSEPSPVLQAGGAAPFPAASPSPVLDGRPSIGEELNPLRGLTAGRYANPPRPREINNEYDAHMRAPTPPMHAVLTRVEDRPAIQATLKAPSTQPSSEKPKPKAHPPPPNGSIRPPTPSGCSPIPYSSRRDANATPPRVHCPVPVKPPQPEKRPEAPSERTELDADLDNDSDGGDSVDIEDYTEKPVPELELPIEPRSLNRTRPSQNQRQRNPMVYSHQPSRSQQVLRSHTYDQLPAQRHRSDVSDSTASRPFLYPPPASESVSLSALSIPRRGLTAAPSNAMREPRGLRAVRSSDTNPNSPHVPSANGTHPPSPGYLASRPVSNGGTPDYASGSYGNGRVIPDSSGSSRITPYTTSKPFVLQTEVAARHIWNIVNKWRGTSEPVSPTSSLDILSDFRVLTSEISSFRPEDKGVVLDRFLGLFEAFGLSDLQSSQSVSSGITRNRHRSDLGDDTDERSTYDGREESGNPATESRQTSQRGRVPTDASSEEETLSWSPVLADSHRQQSDLARRREMSDLLNKWILKTNQPPNGSSTRTVVTPTVPSGLENEVVPVSMDIQELQRLMRQHQSGREESNLADELFKLVHAEASDDSNVFSSSMSAPGQSPTAPPNLHQTRSSDSHSLNRWQVPAGISLKHRPVRPSTTTRMQSDYTHGRYGDSQGTLPSLIDGYSAGDKSSASVGNSSENNSYAVMNPGASSNHNNHSAHGRDRTKPNMATSMGMHDVEYYGPEKKGVAMKIRGALLTMKARNQKLAENLTQFKSNLPTEEIIRILVSILQNVGATVQLKKETKRKLKCRVHMHDDHYLCAAIEFSTDNQNATIVIFKRSKEDRGRTDVSSFHDFYENVRERFIAEVQTRYDRGNRAGHPKRKRSPRYIGGSFG